MIKGLKEPLAMKKSPVFQSNNLIKKPKKTQSDPKGGAPLEVNAVSTLKIKRAIRKVEKMQPGLTQQVK